MIGRPVLLAPAAQRIMGFYSQGTFGETCVTVGAVFLVVAAYAGLRVVLGLQWMNTDKVTAVVFWCVVAHKGVFAQLDIDTAAGMTITTESLRMALNTVCTRPTCYGPVLTHPVGVLVVFTGPVIVMGKGESLGLVTFIAILQRHLGVLFV